MDRVQIDDVGAINNSSIFDAFDAFDAFRHHVIGQYFKISPS
jgi:hypothetical protein